jgi:hypothetical protein
VRSGQTLVPDGSLEVNRRDAPPSEQKGFAMKTARAVSAAVSSLALAAVAVAPSTAAPTQRCQQVDVSTDRVVRGVTLSWDSAFLCANAADSGSWRIVVDVTNRAASTQGVRIRDVVLSHTTPRPRGQGPAATAEPKGLPLRLAPGESGRFRVTGTYRLVSTDEGKKANLHLRALGTGDNGDPFRLGLNVHLRAPGVPAD